MTARRTAAVLEVLGVYSAGQLVMMLLIRMFGLQIVNPLGSFTAGITNAELISATRQMFVLLIVQCAGSFLLIIPINFWYRRRGPAAYGLTKAGRSWTALFLAGLATVALTAWPVMSVGVVDSIYHLGATVPWRQALFDTSWRRWEFWLFTAVSSWGLVPILEEVFYRGYCQRRLAEDWGNGPAIIGSACLFTFAHSQYLLSNAYSLSMVVSLLIVATGLGAVFAWTRSLVPSIIAHAIINIPMTPLWQRVVLAMFVIGALFMARRGVAAVKQVFLRAPVISSIALAVVGAGYAIASQRFDPLTIAGAAILVLAVGLEAVDRHRNRATEPASTSA